MTSIQRWYSLGERTVDRTKSDTPWWRVTFSENVKNVDATDFTLSGTTGSLAEVKITGTRYHVTASGGNIANLDGVVTLGFASNQNITDDPDGNALTNTTPTGTNDNSYRLDHTAPALTSITRQSPAVSPTDADELTWRVTFNEPVWDVEAEYDFSLSIDPEPDNLPTLTRTRVGGFDVFDDADYPVSSVFDVKLSGGDLASLNGTVTLKVDGNILDTADLDTAGGNLLYGTANGHTPTGTNDNTFVVDNAPTVPTVTISGVPDGTNGPFTATFTFSEAVSGFEVSDITLTNATGSAFTETVTGTTWTALITPTAEGAYSVWVPTEVASDANRNGNTASATHSGTYAPPDPPDEDPPDEDPTPTPVMPLPALLLLGGLLAGCGAQQVRRTRL